MVHFSVVFILFCLVQSASLLPIAQGATDQLGGSSSQNSVDKKDIKTPTFTTDPSLKQEPSQESSGKSATSQVPSTDNTPSAWTLQGFFRAIGQLIWKVLQSIWGFFRDPKKQMGLTLSAGLHEDAETYIHTLSLYPTPLSLTRDGYKYSTFVSRKKQALEISRRPGEPVFLIDGLTVDRNLEVLPSASTEEIKRKSYFFVEYETNQAACVPFLYGSEKARGKSREIIPLEKSDQVSLDALRVASKDVGDFASHLAANVLSASTSLKMTFLFDVSTSFNKHYGKAYAWYVELAPSTGSGPSSLNCSYKNFRIILFNAKNQMGKMT